MGSNLLTVAYKQLRPKLILKIERQNKFGDYEVKKNEIIIN